MHRMSVEFSNILMNILGYFRRGKVVSSSTRTSVWMTPEIKIMLQEASKATGLSMAHIMRQAILRECQRIIEMKIKTNVPILICALLLNLCLPLQARQDDYSYYNQPTYIQPNFQASRIPDFRVTDFKVEEPHDIQFTKDMFEGGFKGDFIEKPNFANILGNLTVMFTPAYAAATARDFVANFTSSFQSGFEEKKLPTLLCAAGMIPVIAEAKSLSAAIKAGREMQMETKAAALGIEFAPAMESGLTRRLQAAIVQNINEGEYVAVRNRPYLANFLDGKLPAKAPGMAEVDTAYKNGVRLLKDGNKAVSDLDLAFVVKNGKIVPEIKAMKLGEKINEAYGVKVVTHGDNFNGARKGIEKAIEIEKKKDLIWIFDKNGFVGADDYQTIVKKFLLGR